MADFHPMTVHFPIVLLLLWPFIDGLSLKLQKQEWSQLATALLGLSLLTSLFATITGQAAFDQAIAAGYDSDLLERHTLDADLIPWLIIVLGLARFILPKKIGAKGRWAAVCLGLGLALFLVKVSYEGGNLVYKHGVGVSQTLGK